MNGSGAVWSGTANRLEINGASGWPTKSRGAVSSDPGIERASWSRESPAMARPRPVHADDDRRNRLPSWARHASLSRMMRAASLLEAYDEQLRTDAEAPSAVSVARHGPLRLVTFVGGRGFVTYRDLGGSD